MNRQKSLALGAFVATALGFSVVACSGDNTTGPNTPPAVTSSSTAPRPTFTRTPITTPPPPPPQPSTTQAPAGGEEPYYANCAAVRAAGKAPLHKGDPGYRSALDRDGDGVACE